MGSNGNMITVNNNEVVGFPTEGSNKSTIGHHIARRLVEIGVKDVFAVPGDFNLGLLDSLVAESELNLIGCCNELNAGYGADGYARCKGVGACVVTYNVGGLSVLNAIAGAYGEDLPVICIVGAPNSNDYGSQRIIHHSIGLTDFSQELRCFQPVTCHQAVVNNLEDAHEVIDTAIGTALRESKPVYISIVSNLVGIPHHSFSDEPLPFYLTPNLTDESCLEMAVEATSQFLNKAVKPVMVGGPKLRMAKASNAFMKMVDASDYPFAVLASAKGMVEEHHPNFIGTYWGQISTPFCAQILHSADAYLFAGPLFNDIITLGFSLPFKKEKAIVVLPNRVMIPNGPAIGCVSMKSFFQALTIRLKRNTTTFDKNYKTIHVRDGLPSHPNPKKELRVDVLFMHIQNMLSRDTVVIAETGDAWFRCQKLNLPQGCGYECQMQYGSVGWSVGATLGYAQAAPHKRVIACVGDGSFQMTAQEVSTMLRCGQNCIIFLINNGGYSTEMEIHDGPYTVIKNWDYAGLVEKIDNGEGKCWTTKVHCEEELKEAIKTAMESKKSWLCFIEVIVKRDDTSKDLIILGSRLAAFNGHPPKNN